MRPISIGNDGFYEIRKNNAFYVDKTAFIKEWWEELDKVTLITRPRRFGKTLNMQMLGCFFSERYAGKGEELFDGLDIWKEEKYRQLQGTYPVIFLSFANVKKDTYASAREGIISVIDDLFKNFKRSWKNDSDEQKKEYSFMSLTKESSDTQIANSLHELSSYLEFRYDKKCLIFLDEYDTPLQEAYVRGYWDEMSYLIRDLFNSTFKTNPSMERGVMTGITRVSKESIFSGLNNLNVITTTSRQYETAFGFTEKETFDALEEYGLSDMKSDVREWYDGFTFGDTPDVYNPWSIVNFLKKRELQPYWANSSNNGIINRQLRLADASIKSQMETLMNGGSIETKLDEEIIFSQLDRNPKAIWSLFLAGGYLKVVKREFDGSWFDYTLTLTDKEVRLMFEQMINGWFSESVNSNNEFIHAMINGDVDGMNVYINKIASISFSSFDVGNRTSESTTPERFYHGFVLGILVSERNRYLIRSNRESGYGRYDICMYPQKKDLPGIIIEFKVQNENAGEETLSDTADIALQQIEAKDYASDLKSEGVENILKYGFAFAGKKVFIKKR
ncbi:MAG TPA: hypothetical protein DCQ87_06200 [Lachnospiraceae bacterium]|nr:hypothetical protein [Lachnospiraceae bacterium]